MHCSLEKKGEFFFLNELAELGLGVIFSTFTQSQVKRDIFSGELVVLKYSVERGYFLHSFAEISYFSISLAIVRDGLQSSSSLMESQLYGELTRTVRH